MTSRPVAHAGGVEAGRGERGSESLPGRASRYIAPATTLCLEALRRAPLVSATYSGWRGSRVGWRYRNRRMFSCHTVSMLIEAGLAVRVGDEVRMA